MWLDFHYMHAWHSVHSCVVVKYFTNTCIFIYKCLNKLTKFPSRFFEKNMVFPKKNEQKSIKILYILTKNFLKLIYFFKKMVPLLLRNFECGKCKMINPESVRFSLNTVLLFKLWNCCNWIRIFLNMYQKHFLKNKHNNIQLYLL